MEYQGLGIESSVSAKASVCEDCISNSKKLDANIGHSVEFISSNIERHLMTDMSALLENELIPRFDIRRIALYELLVKFKKSDLRLNELEITYYNQAIVSAKKAEAQAAKLFVDIKPDLVICYSPQYVVPGATAAAAIKLQIPTYFAEGSSGLSLRYRALRIYNWEQYGLASPTLETWNKSKIRLNLKDLLHAKCHFRIIKQGRSHSVYSVRSKKHSIRNEFQIPKHVRIILAVLSSSDEVFSAHAIQAFTNSKAISTVYDSQFSWITDLIDYVKQQTNTTLVIRVHPRDFPNSREDQLSDAASTWTKILRSEESKIVLDFPVDGRSLYDILEEVDVVTTGWSSVAIEAAHLGLPVVTYDQKLPSFPVNIHTSGSRKVDYFKNLSVALQSTVTKRDLRKEAARWLAFRDSYSTFDVGGGILEWLPFIFSKSLSRIAERIYRINPILFRRIEAKLPVKRKVAHALFRYLFEENKTI